MQHLREVLPAVKDRSQICVVTGRQRTGKTHFALEAVEGTEQVPTLYFHVARKAEGLLCAEWADEAKRQVSLPVMQDVQDFRSLLKTLMAVSKDQPLNIIIDEFQEFNTINAAIWTELQSLWDRNRERSHVNIVFVGNDNRLTEAIFEGDHAPLAGRTAAWEHLHPYTRDELKEVVRRANAKATPADQLAMWAFTGGVQGYVHDFIEKGALTADKMIDLLTAKDSPYIYEGKQLLVEDFGKEYTIYFSILTCIANGLISRASIEEYIQKEIGGYLTRLETEFHLIEKQTPLFSRTGSKNVRYLMTDNFLRFWFRHIFAHSALLELGKYDELRSRVKADYREFERTNLKNYVRDEMRDSGQWEQVGGWWDHRGDVLIDLIGYNTQTHKAEVVEVLHSDDAEDMNALVQKGAVLNEHLAGYAIDYKLRKNI